MKTLEMAKATESLSNYACMVRKEPMILTVRGKPFMALVNLKNTDMETATLSTNARFMKLMERSRRKYQSRGGITKEEMRRRVR